MHARKELKRAGGPEPPQLNLPQDIDVLVKAVSDQVMKRLDSRTKGVGITPLPGVDARTISPAEDEAIKKRIATNLIGERKRAGVSQSELARRVGAYPSTISNIERKRSRTTLEFLLRVSRALGCDVVDLLKKDPSGNTVLPE